MTFLTPKPEMEEVYEELYWSRVIFQREIHRAVSCIFDVEKKELAREWKKKYSDTMYQELIKMAKNHEARLKVLEWEIPRRPYRTKK